MDPAESVVLQRLRQALLDLLSGRPAAPLAEHGRSLDGGLQALCETTNHLIEQFNEAHDFLSSLSRGILEIDPPPRNLLISPFKRLHSNLRHLTWQTEQVATGDFSQRVDFLGQFSEAFNAMIASLREKREIELALERSEERLRLAIDGGDLGLWDYDIVSGKAVFNERWAGMLGYDPDEVEPRIGFWHELIHPGDKEDFMEAWESHLKCGSPPMLRVEHRLHAGTGDWKWILCVGRIVDADAQGNPSRVAGVFVDITDRKLAEDQIRQKSAEVESHSRSLQQANELLRREIAERKAVEEALRKSEERFRTIFETAQDSIFIKDLDLKYIHVNPAFEKLVGRPASQLLGLGSKDLFEEAAPPYSQEIDRRVLRGEIVEEEHTRRIRGITKTFNVIKVPMRDSSNRIVGLCGIARDITDRKRQEEELLNAKDAAEGANRAKSAFLANMSHELRTPLNAIMGYAQILQKEKNLTSKQVDQLKTIQSSGEHLLTLISDILDLSRIEAQKMEVEAKEFDLPDLIHAVLSTTGIKAQKKRLSLQYEECSSLPKNARGDRRKIQQILLNLLDNAVKYTDKGGVTLRFSGSESLVPGENQSQQYLHEEKPPGGEPRLARLHNAGAVCCCRFEVSDTGTGIPSDRREQIFEPFIHGEFDPRCSEGIGLGLAICRRLVDLMGGRLFLESEVGKGSTFIVELDLEVGELVKKAAREPERTIIGYMGQRKGILVVDDDIASLSMLVSLLEPLGFGIERAERGEEAVRIASESRPNLILLDLLMPGMDGYETLRQIRSDTSLKQCKIIGISAAVADKVRAERFSEACDDFLFKPVEIMALLDKIKAQLQIEWIEEGEPAIAVSTGPPATDADKPVKLPSSTVLEEIIEKANEGNFTELERIIQELLLLDAGYGGFCSTIEAYAQAYDDEAILKYLNNLGQDTIE